MQKINLLHQFILEIEQILVSQNQKDHAYFWPNHPKTIKVTFAFSEFLSTQQKLVYSINSFFRYSQF